MTHWHHSLSNFPQESRWFKIYNAVTSVTFHLLPTAQRGTRYFFRAANRKKMDADSPENTSILDEWCGQISFGLAEKAEIGDSCKIRVWNQVPEVEHLKQIIELTSGAGRESGSSGNERRLIRWHAACVIMPAERRELEFSYRLQVLSRNGNVSYANGFNNIRIII